MTGLRDQLTAIHDQHGGLTPTLVVDLARDAGHPLHGHFEWDDTVAAEKWRRTQAGELIRSVGFVVREGTDKNPSESVRAFQAVRGEEGFVYRRSEEIAEDPFLTKLVLADMERDWKALKRRYQRFSEFVAMVRKDVAS